MNDVEDEEISKVFVSCSRENEDFVKMCYRKIAGERVYCFSIKITLRGVPSGQLISKMDWMVANRISAYWDAQTFTIYGPIGILVDPFISQHPI